MTKASYFSRIDKSKFFFHEVTKASCVWQKQVFFREVSKASCVWQKQSCVWQKYSLRWQKYTFAPLLAPKAQFSLILYKARLTDDNLKGRTLHWLYLSRVRIMCPQSVQSASSKLSRDHTLLRRGHAVLVGKVCRHRWSFRETTLSFDEVGRCRSSSSRHRCLE